MGTVWLNDPLNKEVAWYDWCSYDYYVQHYVNGFSKGTFLWIVSNPDRH